MSAVEEPRTSWFARTRGFVTELWNVIRRPSSVFGLGVLVLAGFVAGVIFWGGFNTAMEITNTEKFCTGCHSLAIRARFHANIGPCADGRYGALACRQRT